MLCQKCGSKMEEHWNAPDYSVVCPECGWGYATTKFEPIDEDRTDYTITLPASSKADTAAIKAVASVGNLNYPEAKKAIEQGCECLVVEKARTIAEKKALLEQADVAFEITPSFPY